LANLPPGCAFAERCGHANDTCRRLQPEPVVFSAGHRVRCHHIDTVTALA
jgi:peptide/nickel transport system ATP-binding protein